MITTFAILMLLYNMWLVFYLITERLQPQEKEEPEVKPTDTVKER